MAATLAANALFAVPRCNMHDWYVGVRNGKVETVWPVSARGKAF